MKEMNFLSCEKLILFHQVTLAHVHTHLII